MITMIMTTTTNTSHNYTYNNSYLYPQPLFEIHCSFRLDMLTVYHHWGAEEVVQGRGGREGG